MSNCATTSEGGASPQQASPIPRTICHRAEQLSSERDSGTPGEHHINSFKNLLWS